MRFLKTTMLVCVFISIFINPISAQSNPDGKIAFTTKRDGNEEIYLMNADGSNPVNLTQHDANDWQPAWSPDGRQMLFNTDRDGSWQIYVMNADGSNPTRVTNEPGNHSSPSWSPDGHQIAYASDREGSWEIYVADVDGSNARRLTANGQMKAHTAWSPDGLKIAFWQDYGANNEIFIVGVDGQEPYPITQNTEHDGWINWSPDGRHLAFDTHRDGNWEVYLMNTNGSVPVNLSTNDAVDGRPGWSPDGTQVIFNSDRDGNPEIYTMNADGSNPVNLTNHPGEDYSPAWQPPLPTVTAELAIVTAAEGGPVSLPDGATVFFPPDSLTEDAGVLFTRTTYAESGLPPFDQDLIAISDAYDVQLTNGDMVETVMFGIPYDPDTLPGSLDEGELLVAKPSPDGWQYAPGMVDPEAHMVYFYMNDLVDPLIAWSFVEVEDKVDMAEEADKPKTFDFWISPSSGPPGTTFKIKGLPTILPADEAILWIYDSDHNPVTAPSTELPGTLFWRTVNIDFDTTDWKPGAYTIDLRFYRADTTEQDLVFRAIRQIGIDDDVLYLTDLHGSAEKRVVDYMTRHNLDYTLTYEHSTEPEGRVISQHPEPDTPILPDDRPNIEVAISFGPEPKFCNTSDDETCARITVLDHLAKPISNVRVNLYSPVFGIPVHVNRAVTSDSGTLAFPVKPDKTYYFSVKGTTPDGRETLWTNKDCSFTLWDGEMKDFYVVLDDKHTTCATRNGSTLPLWAELSSDETQITWNMVTGLVNYDRLEWSIMREDNVIVKRDANENLTIDLMQPDLFPGVLPGLHVVRLDATYGGETHTISNQVSINLADVLPDAVVNTDALRMRREPGLGGQQVATLDKQIPLTVLGRLADNSWVRVKTEDNQEGWVFTDLVKLNIPLDDVEVLTVQIVDAPTNTQPNADGSTTSSSSSGNTQSAVLVPDMIGWDGESAEEWLSMRRFNYTITGDWSEVYGYGKVVSMNPPGGQTYDRATTVFILDTQPPIPRKAD